jgi:hypothetical protein
LKNGAIKTVRTSKLIYIAGYSRSGSTVMDILLGSHEDAFSCGELTYLLEDSLNDDRSCACGNRYSSCPVWGQIPKGNDEDSKVLREVECRQVLKASKASEQQYAEIVMAMLSKIRVVTGCRILIDSSKNSKDPALRMERLQTICNEDVYVVHLVRDYFSTISSYYVNGSNCVSEGHGQEKSFLLLRSSLGWMIANTIAWWLGRRLRYLAVDHNEFLRDPLATLDAIEQFVDEDFSSTKQRVKEGQVLVASHNVGGNRVRREGILVKGRDLTNSITLPLWVKVFGYICGPKLLESFIFRRAKSA